MTQACQPPRKVAPEVVVPELGRLITREDLVLAHRGPDRCLCRGSAVIHLAPETSGKPKTKFCETAVNHLRKYYGKDLRDTPRGPRWIKGREPEAQTAPAAEA
jgi:hypothetical protein